MFLPIDDFVRYSPNRAVVVLQILTYRFSSLRLNYLFLQQTLLTKFLQQIHTYTKCIRNILYALYITAD